MPSFIFADPETRGVYMPLDYSPGDPKCFDNISPAVIVIRGVFGTSKIAEVVSLQDNNKPGEAFVLLEELLHKETDAETRQDALNIRHALLYDNGQHEEAIDTLELLEAEYLEVEDFFYAANVARRIGRSYRDLTRSGFNSKTARLACIGYSRAADLFATAYDHKKIEIEDSEDTFLSSSQKKSMARRSSEFFETLREHLYALPKLYPDATQLFVRLDQAREIYRKSASMEPHSEYGLKQKTEIKARIKEFEVAARTRKKLGSRTLARLIEA